jgi:hypothetical protein
MGVSGPRHLDAFPEISYGLMVVICAALWHATPVQPPRVGKNAGGRSTAGPRESSQSTEPPDQAKRSVLLETVGHLKSVAGLIQIERRITGGVRSQLARLSDHVVEYQLGLGGLRFMLTPCRVSPEPR